MSETRLSMTLVEQKNSLIYRPEYCPVGIVHLGIGAFHRAHQAVYTHDYMASCEDKNWFITGVSLRSANVRNQLDPQNGLYNVKVSSRIGHQNELVQSVTNVLVAPEDPQAVLQLMTAESVKIISLTITEKGYCHDPASGDLNLAHPDIVEDLKNLETPRSAIGYLVSSLHMRFERQLPPVTILCCDNLPNNGSTLKKIVLQFADLVDPQLAKWIAKEIPFPNTMVDRIVPATTEADITEFADQMGYQDKGMVKTEAFSQWVIEDNFANGRPLWEKSGALLVKDVEAFENAKLRLLNGAHSALAYSGFLSGYHYVHEVMQQPDFVAFLKNLMENEVKATIIPPEGLNLQRYIEQLLERFSNPALHHKTYQIAMDGSQKMPQRLLHTIEDRLRNGASIDYLCFAVAGWLRYTMAFDAAGDPIDVQDPLAAELEAIQKAEFHDIDKLVSAYLDFDKVFSSALRQNTVFRGRLSYWLSYILANGVPTALKSLLVETHNYSFDSGKRQQ